MRFVERLPWSPVFFGAVLFFVALGGKLSLGQVLSGEATLDEPLVVVEEVLEAPLPIEDPPAPRIDLHLPTDNAGLIHGDEAAFYSPLDKEHIPGLRRFGWEGGRYGFVRNEARSPAGPIFTRLHQGIDIRPLYRDRRGEPLDTVRAIATGTVAYVNHGADRSSYGRYVVVRHEWDGSEVYSLLAHLESIWVSEGDFVIGGEPLGRLGYTGTGINQRRAHVHLEIALRLSDHFSIWHARNYAGRNWHGIYNGLNLRAIDPARFYLIWNEDPSLSFAEYVRAQPIAYRLALPGGDRLSILDRYPWLSDDGLTNDAADAAGAWLVGFTQEGVPVEIARQAAPVARPEVVFVAQHIRQGHLSTAGILGRAGANYTVTRHGQAYAALLATYDGRLPAWF